VEQELKKGVHARQEFCIDIQPGQLLDGGEVADEAAVAGIDPITGSGLGRIGLVAGKEPASGRDLPGGATAIPDIIPETLQVGRIGKYATNAYDGNGLGVLNAQAAPNCTRPGGGSWLRLKACCNEGSMTHS
jgi:hypothetical protein